MLNLNGVIVPIITPKINDSVDNISLKNMMNFLVESGIDSIFILGTTGEFQFLSMKQKKEIIKNSSIIIGKKIPILVGVSDEDLTNTLELTKYAEKHNADAVVIAPLFIKGDIHSNLSNFIKNSHLPIILYNNPAIHKNGNIPLEFVSKFSSNERFVGIKDSSGDWDYFQKLLDFSSDDFAVYQGRENSIIESLNQGAKGIVPGSANIAPKLFNEIYSSRNPAIMDKIIAVKKEIKNLSDNYIFGIKQKLVMMELIKTDKMF